MHKVNHILLIYVNFIWILFLLIFDLWIFSSDMSGSWNLGLAGGGTGIRLFFGGGCNRLLKGIGCDVGRNTCFLNGTI